MKVLVLVLLLVTVSSMEAATVKRETNPPTSLDTITEFFTSMKEQTEELVKRFNAPELHQQAQNYFEESRKHIEPVRAELEKIWQGFLSKWKWGGEQQQQQQ